MVLLVRLVRLRCCEARRCFEGEGGRGEMDRSWFFLAWPALFSFGGAVFFFALGVRVDFVKIPRDFGLLLFLSPRLPLKSKSNYFRRPPPFFSLICILLLRDLATGPSVHTNRCAVDEVRLSVFQFFYGSYRKNTLPPINRQLLTDLSVTKSFIVSSGQKPVLSNSWCLISRRALTNQETLHQSVEPSRRAVKRRWAAIHF
ncbi:hypothetical protein B0T20DRAFT_32186 [Sordaria brevicollis]|uniref:Uncharacterized protein n=1 Tax=Sordaria brevicollis TaxID=83679 RepID=A0AAE0P8P3_SORBR|nr:hypothetical protein B0T20DRAFT_32186 [Sordaria brevicollis]